MYPDTHCDKIQPGDNVIIALGDSFTQGVGCYSEDTWRSIPEDEQPSLYNISGQKFLDEQGKNNWARQLQQRFLPNYKVMNLAINGAGNRAIVKELYLNELSIHLNNVIVILLATGIERFDFFKQNDDTSGINWHQKWQTIWPAVTEGRGKIGEIESLYLESIWCSRNDALEFLLNVKDAENFCKVKKYKFLFASAFDEQINRSSLIKLLDDKRDYINIIDWNNFIEIKYRRSFLDMINQINSPPKSVWEIYDYHRKLRKPENFITPCGHWSIEGSKIVSEYIYKELIKRKLI